VSQTKRLPRIYVGPKPSSPPLTNSITTTSPLVDRIAISTTTTNTYRLSPKSIVPLTADQAHYLHVMRIQSVKRWGNDAGIVRIFNGIDGEWLARVVIGGGGGDGDDIDGSKKKNKAERRKRRNSSSRVGGSGGGEIMEDGAILECIHQILTQDQQQDCSHQDVNISVQLYIGQLKKQRIRWVVEKATELGVDGITILDTEYTTETEGWVREYDKHVIQLIEAAEQCERLSIPCLSPDSVSLVDLASFVGSSILQKENNNDDNDDEQQRHLWLVCRERSSDSMPIIPALQNAMLDFHGTDVVDRDTSKRHHHHHLNIHILVGPEGGWSPNELEAFSNVMTSTTMIKFVSLGSLVLRAETAAITAVAAAKMI
jgi:16S rRNA U1498 N3-methylase RsmE